MGDAVRLGLAMTALQVSIGALNDVVDAPTDRGRRPSKPVADGLVSPLAAQVVTVAAAAIGLGLAAGFGPATLAVAIAGLGCGYAYDLVFSRTVGAWLPLAVALPLVPVFAWLGATGTVPAGLAVIVPIAMVAGAGLAVGNALADLPADAASGAPSIARRLGRTGAWSLHAAALALAVIGAVLAYPRAGGEAALALVLGGSAVLALGVAGLAAPSPAAGGSLGRRAWQVEAVGVFAIGLGWFLAFAAAPPPV